MKKNVLPIISLMLTVISFLFSFVIIFLTMFIKENSLFGVSKEMPVLFLLALPCFLIGNFTFTPVVISKLSFVLNLIKYIKDKKKDTLTRFPKAAIISIISDVLSKHLLLISYLEVFAALIYFMILSFMGAASMVDIVNGGGGNIW